MSYYLSRCAYRSEQGFSRGSSTYRGVTAHPSGRWESRIGIPGSKHIYLGLFENEREAAAAYDKSLVRLRGSAAATNFSLSEYRPELAEYHTFQQVLGLCMLSRPTYTTCRTCRAFTVQLLYDGSDAICMSCKRVSDERQILFTEPHRGGGGGSGRN